MNFNYESEVNFLNRKELNNRINFIRNLTEKLLSEYLNLTRMTSPLIINSSINLNDDLNGEKPVSFDTTWGQIEIVQSHAKYKRVVLSETDELTGNFLWNPYEGIYTEMNAIRPNEIPDATHSLYVDQFDWEMVIHKEDRNVAFLKKIVRKIYAAIRVVDIHYSTMYGTNPILPNSITFITTQELLNKYPSLNAKQREDAFAKEVGAFFLLQIGDKLSNGTPHDDRSPSYDDWSLNGDIIVYSPVLGRALELSSMGIRVDAKSLVKQYKNIGKTLNISQYENNILTENFNYTIGGGIGQSRLCMLILQAKHIGQVQCAPWPSNILKEMKSDNIELLF